MKVHIEYDTTDAPYGGGNQFIKALKSYFSSLGALTAIEEAEVVLFNSHHKADKILSLKNSFPNKKFVHRVDGPMRLYNDMSDSRDSIVYRINDLAADGTVFQSEWSKNANLKLGMSNAKPSTVILNGTDHKIFYAPHDKLKSEKIRLISTSFSPNPKKGFDTYKYIDQNLNFDRFDYFFAGNSPVKFENIKNLGSLTSNDLANRLRKSDVFITASQKDPCSNSLIEAISCNLHVLALSDGGHTEIIDNADCMFDTRHKLLKMLTACSFSSSKKQYSIEKSAAAYLDFFGKLIST